MYDAHSFELFGIWSATTANVENLEKSKRICQGPIRRMFASIQLVRDLLYRLASGNMHRSKLLWLHLWGQLIRGLVFCFFLTKKHPFSLRLVKIFSVHLSYIPRALLRLTSSSNFLHTWSETSYLVVLCIQGRTKSGIWLSLREQRCKSWHSLTQQNSSKHQSGEKGCS